MTYSAMPETSFWHTQSRERDACRFLKRSCLRIPHEKVIIRSSVVKVFAPGIYTRCAFMSFTASHMYESLLVETAVC